MPTNTKVYQWCGRTPPRCLRRIDSGTNWINLIMMPKFANEVELNLIMMPKSPDEVGDAKY